MLTLPWPPKALSPNSRTHRLAKAKAAKAYRLACWAIAKQSGIKLAPGRYALNLTFFPPTKQPRDLDNCLASIKAGLDGVADAWGINDRDFRPITIDLAETIGGLILLKCDSLEDGGPPM
jgi:crossover junction endodeoxyribonuclease RusA